MVYSVLFFVFLIIFHSKDPSNHDWVQNLLLNLSTKRFLYLGWTIAWRYPRLVTKIESCIFYLKYIWIYAAVTSNTVFAVYNLYILFVLRYEIHICCSCENTMCIYHHTFCKRVMLFILPVCFTLQEYSTISAALQMSTNQPWTAIHGWKVCW